jgi:hypothetical protein
MTKNICLALIVAASLQAATIDVIFYDNRIGTVNDTTGAYAQIATLPVSASSGIAALNGMLYVENMGSDLYEVDPGTGISSLVGPTGLSTTSGAFAGAASGFFEIDYSSNLYSIDPLTGKAMLVGATGLQANNGGYDTSLSDDGSSLLYTAGRPGQADELYRINIGTGIATDLGSTGVTGIAGSAFVNGELELFQYGQSQNYIYSAPDGSVDFLQESILGAQIVDGGAVFSNVESSDQSSGVAPEPGAAQLLILGLLLLCYRRIGLALRPIVSYARVRLTRS